MIDDLVIFLFSVLRSSFFLFCLVKLGIISLNVPVIHLVMVLSAGAGAGAGDGDGMDWQLQDMN